MPVHRAARNGHFRCRPIGLSNNGCPWRKSIYMFLSMGFMDLLQSSIIWTTTCIAMVPLKNGCPRQDKICSAAAEGGHLHVLIYGVEKKGCPWDAYTGETAARYGHFTHTANGVMKMIFIWKRNEFVPWPPTVVTFRYCNGVVTMVIHGMKAHVQRRH